jgi:ribokinase
VTRRFVAVVGTVNHDIIVPEEGPPSESLGGILYNAIPLAALLEGSGLEVVLIGRLGPAHRDEVIERLARFAHVDARGLIADPAGTNRSRLDYSRGGDRVETVDMRVATLSEEDLAPLDGAEAVLVNMISGRDVRRTALARRRERSRGRFFLDVQALARSLTTPRRSRVVPDGPEWARVFHVVRGNDEEIAHLGGAPGDVRAAAGRLLAAGAEEVLATHGTAGATRFVTGSAGLEAEQYPAFPCGKPVDPTGCGDSFLAAVVAAHVLGLPPGAGVRLGAFVAARVAGLSGLDSLEALDGIRRQASSVVPELPA